MEELIDSVYGVHREGSTACYFSSSSVCVGGDPGYVGGLLPFSALPPPAEVMFLLSLELVCVYLTRCLKSIQQTHILSLQGSGWTGDGSGLSLGSNFTLLHCPLLTLYLPSSHQ